MPDKTKPIPEGFRTITPHLIVRDADKALDFYQQAFGARVLGVMRDPGNKIMHAAIKIGDSIVMLNDEFPEWNTLSPQSLNGSSVTLHVYVENADATFNKAVAAGATVTMPLQNQFWGDRYGKLTDPFGHNWSVATKVEDVSEEEMKKRHDQMFAQTTK